MDEKTTNELNHILKSCTTLSHLEAALTELPEKERLTLKCYLEELLETKGLNKADVIREANIARTYGYQIFQGERLVRRDASDTAGVQPASYNSKSRHFI